MWQIELAITGMTCSSCTQRLRHALQAVAGVQEVSLPGWQSGRALVRAKEQVGVDSLLQAVHEAGYRAAPMQEQFSDRPEGSDQPTERVVDRPTPSGKARQPDLLVIGGGSAGFAAAIRAAELGRSVTLVEAGTIGGTCVNVGCVPSKTLLAAMERYEQAATPSFEGLSTAGGRLAWSRLVAQKDALVAQLRQEKYLDILPHYPTIELVRDRAWFEDDEVVMVGDRRYHPDVTLIATGARPAIPPIPGLDRVPYLDSTAALALRELPRSIIVIGGGAIGVELGQLFARAGSAVTIVELLPRLLPLEEAELGEALAAELSSGEGIRLETGARVERVEESPHGVRLLLSREGAEIMIEGERLLVATGRRANSDGLALEAAGIETDRQGAIVVNERLQTSNPRVFAAGDVTGVPQYVYVAAHTGGLAAENALTGSEKALDLTAVPRVTFTDPALAAVGLTEGQARESGIEVETTILPLKFVPRALANHDTRGLIKLVMDGGSGKLLGAHILAAGAGEMIQPAILGIEHGLTVEQLADSYYPYLTMVEGMKLALLSFKKEIGALSCCAV